MQAMSHPSPGVTLLTELTALWWPGCWGGCCGAVFANMRTSVTSCGNRALHLDGPHSSASLGRSPSESIHQLKLWLRRTSQFSSSLYLSGLQKAETRSRAHWPTRLQVHRWCGFIRGSLQTHVKQLLVRPGDERTGRAQNCAHPRWKDAGEVDASEKEAV